jgi:hypothetical protein
MAESIDAARAVALIAQAEAIRKDLQKFIDALRAAAGETIDAGDGIAHPPVVRPPP